MQSAKTSGCGIISSSTVHTVPGVCWWGVWVGWGRVRYKVMRIKGEGKSGGSGEYMGELDGYRNGLTVMRDTSPLPQIVNDGRNYSVVGCV